MTRVRIDIDGGGDVAAALRRLVGAYDAAGRRQLTKAAHLIERNIKLELSQSSHPPGTPTPSPPGSPPSLVTGNLRRSVRVTGPTRISGGWEARVGPTAVYGRVQEFGGACGRGLRTQLPARPYVRPGARKSRPGLARIFGPDWRP